MGKPKHPPNITIEGIKFAQPTRDGETYSYSYHSDLLWISLTVYPQRTVKGWRGDYLSTPRCDVHVDVFAKRFGPHIDRHTSGYTGTTNESVVNCCKHAVSRVLLRHQLHHEKLHQFTGR